MGSRGGGVRGGGDPSHLDRSRRDTLRLRLPAHGRRLHRGFNSGDRFRRRRDVRSLRRSVQPGTSRRRARRLGVPLLRARRLGAEATPQRPGYPRQMLIPSIDLQGGKIVQLVQGERLAVETSDIESWIAKFSSYSKVQLIDLDAAKGAGSNDAIVARICGALPCRVGGGIRSIERARVILGVGATKVILGSSLFMGNSVNVDFAQNLSAQIGPE